MLRYSSLDELAGQSYCVVRVQRDSNSEKKIAVDPPDLIFIISVPVALHHLGAGVMEGMASKGGKANVPPEENQIAKISTADSRRICSMQVCLLECWNRRTVTSCERAKNSYFASKAQADRPSLLGLASWRCDVVADKKCSIVHKMNPF